MMRISLLEWNPAGATPAPHDDAQGQVCVANIDAAGRRQRLAAGIIELVIGFGILGVLLALHANPLWRLPLLLVFWGAAVGFFQWRDRTWTGLAGRGSRLIDNKLEEIGDPDELTQVRRQARRVIIKAFVAGAVLTLLVLALPR